MFFHEGVCVVVVDAFEILCLHPPPCDARVDVHLGGDAADEVLDKNRVGVGPLGHGFFIGTLKHAVEFAAGGTFRHGDHYGERYGFVGTQRESDLSALVMRTGRADGFRARAQGGYVDDDGADEIEHAIIGRCAEAGGVIDETGGAGDGGFFPEKEGKFEFEVGALAVESGDERAQQFLDVLRMKDRAVRLEHFQKAAHVRAFEVMGQIDGELNRGDCALRVAGCGRYLDGEAEIFHADAVDVDAPVVRLALRVAQRGGSGGVVGLFHGGGSLIAQGPGGKNDLSGLLRKPDALVCRAVQKLTVNEIYQSVQGESTWAGLPCVFVRLTFCDLRCTYCDTEYAFYEGQKMPLEEIVEKVRIYGCRLVEVTGGEPLLQPACVPLLAKLCDEGFTVLLETSGAHDIGPVDPRVHRIMDLKTPSSGESGRNLYANITHLTRRDEVKFVIGSRGDYEWVREKVKEYDLAERVNAVLLSPIFGKIAPSEIVAWMLEDKLPVRFQLQMHKFIWEPRARGV